MAFTTACSSRMNGSCSVEPMTSIISHSMFNAPPDVDAAIFVTSQIPDPPVWDGNAVVPYVPALRRNAHTVHQPTGNHYGLPSRGYSHGRNRHTAQDGGSYEHISCTTS